MKGAIIRITTLGFVDLKTFFNWDCLILAFFFQAITILGMQKTQSYIHDKNRMHLFDPFRTHCFLHDPAGEPTWEGAFGINGR
jgi:hypothetical protein